ncbi:MAG: hypothetical protein WD512_12345 [Candidatus Paceibacterota bacterium]
MTQLPLLIKELIGWYIWKDKITECNREYHKIVEFDLHDGDERRVNLINFYVDKMQTVKHYFRQHIQYRDYNNKGYADPIIYNFTFHSIMRVAILPKRYYYSSGMCFRFGYTNNSDQPFTDVRNNQKITSCRKINKWLPDFM